MKECLRSRPVSPRMVALERDLRLGVATALERFWAEIQTVGTPLVETIPDDHMHCLLTFMWRAREPTSTVVVMGGPGGWTFRANQMQHLSASDLWYRTYRVRRDARFTYRLSPNDCLREQHEIDGYDAEAVRARFATARPDPLNRWPYPSAGEPTMSAVVLPAAPPQPFAAHRPDAVAGSVRQQSIHSTVLGNERRLWVYTPPRYSENNPPYPLLLVFDGAPYTSLVPTPTILDNLAADGAVPPVVAVMIDSLDQQTRAREMTCNPAFVAFLEGELLPWVRRHYAVTADPAQTVLAGSSLGGLTAAFAAFRCPHLFGAVLSQSGAFNWCPVGAAEAEWLPRQFAAARRLPLRFYLDVGRYETGGAFTVDGPSIRLANRHMRDILQARRYQLCYGEFAGGHDYLCWRGTLSDGLRALLGG